MNSIEDLLIPTITPASDRAIMIRFSTEISENVHEQVSYFHNILSEKYDKKISNISPAYNSLLIRLEDSVSLWRMIAKLKQLFNEDHNVTIKEKQTIKIPVCYEGEFAPDIERVSSYTLMSIEEIIHKHTKGQYLIYFIGFSPGFPYIGGMDLKLETPRIASPRINVPAGSVAIGGKQTGIYPIQSPGGWNIIGRTPLKLFDWSRLKKPALPMGGRIEFYPINKKDFHDNQVSLF